MFTVLRVSVSSRVSVGVAIIVGCVSWLTAEEEEEEEEDSDERGGGGEEDEDDVSSCSFVSLLRDIAAVSKSEHTMPSKVFTCAWSG